MFEITTSQNKTLWSPDLPAGGCVGAAAAGGGLVTFDDCGQAAAGGALVRGFAYEPSSGRIELAGSGMCITAVSFKLFSRQVARPCPCLRRRSDGSRLTLPGPAGCERHPPGDDQGGGGAGGGGRGRERLPVRRGCGPDGAGRALAFRCPFAAFRRLSPPFAAFRRLSPPFTAVLLQTNLIADPTMASKIAAMNVSLQVRPHGNAGFLALKQCLSLQLEVEKFFSNQDKFGPAPHPAPRTSLQTARATV